MSAWDVAQQLAIMVLWFWPLAYLLDLIGMLLVSPLSLIWRRLAFGPLIISEYLICLYFSMWCTRIGAMGVSYLLPLIVGFVVVLISCSRMFRGAYKAAIKLDIWTTVITLIAVVIMCMAHITAGSVILEWYFWVLDWIASISFMSVILSIVAVPVAAILTIWGLIKAVYTFVYVYNNEWQGD